ncbi:MAG TPA: hypothetical protein VM935_06010 [Chitinophagaceae bacterium]|nr:hypothetical protein [Chitinophagaceae bacterium]
MKTECCLLIKDDGAGFGKVKLSKGIGLRNSSKPMEKESGGMELKTTPGNVRTFNVCILI